MSDTLTHLDRLEAESDCVGEVADVDAGREGDGEPVAELGA